MDFTYDSIGNLVKDRSEGIDSILWDGYGKVSAVRRIANSQMPELEFGYDAGGNRVRKSVLRKDGTRSDWFYARDAQGEVMGIYEVERVADTVETWLRELPVYGADRLGLVRADARVGARCVSGCAYSPDTSGVVMPALRDGGNFGVPGAGAGTGISVEGVALGQVGTGFLWRPVMTGLDGDYARVLGGRMYELKNHLGIHDPLHFSGHDVLLATVSDLKVGVAVSAVADSVGCYRGDVLSLGDYYPFGSAMPGREFVSSEYRYGFGGHEKDEEMKGIGLSYTTEFRSYDPRIGRWISCDPVFHPQYSPYSAFDNNPIVLSDPLGADSGDQTKEGKEKKDRKTDLSKENLSQKDDNLNIMVVSSNAYDPDVTKHSERFEYNPKTTLVIYASSLSNLEGQLKDLKEQYGKEVKSLILSSHGHTDYARVRLGNNEYTIENADGFSRLRKYLSSNSEILITACSSGNPDIGGAEFIRKIAENTGVKVAGSQSWVINGACGPDSNIEGAASYNFAGTPCYNWAIAHRGYWTVAVPSMTSEGTKIKLYSVEDVRIDVNGNFYIKNPNVKMLNPVQDSDEKKWTIIENVSYGK